MDATKVDLIPRDTTLDAYRVQIEALRRLGPEGRLRLTLEKTDEFYESVRAKIRKLHPDYDEQQVALAVIGELHGQDLMAKVSEWLRNRSQS